MLTTRLKKFYSVFEHLALTLFFSLSFVFFLYHLVFARRIIPGVYLEGVGSLSGLSPSQALAQFGNRITEMSEKEINFSFSNYKTTLTPKSLGVSFDVKETVSTAYNVGRSGNLTEDVLTEIKSLILRKSVGLSYNLDDQIWADKSSGLYRSLSRREANFGYNGDLYIQNEKEGLAVPFPEFQKTLLVAVVRLDNQISLDLERLTPKITAKKLEGLRSQVKYLLANRPNLVRNSERLVIDENLFLKMLDFSTSSPSADLASIKEFTKSLSSKYNRPSRSLSFEAEGSKVVKFSPGQDGLAVNEDSLLTTLAQEIILGRSSNIPLPLKKTEARIEVNRYGIKELIGLGHSTFTGSIPGRIKNIKRASGILNGLLVPPGEVFSFDDSVGEISDQTGYDYAYIIKEGRTVLGTGGGICQVSTTIFRAALNAGLPIVKRTAHAYRVHFYEEGGSPVGLDATVYPPTVDFQFKNDTATHILIASEVDGDNLNFRIYGTSDGRAAKLIGPTILSQSPAPQALYQDDPTLPKGEIKQVDFAAAGANVVFEREVSRDGQLLFKDRFVSNYRPWQAIYLVGTKT